MAAVGVQLDGEAQGLDLLQKCLQPGAEQGLSAGDADPVRLARKASSSPLSMAAGRGPVTRSRLWQKGQRKSQPPRKIVQATRPGQSSSVNFCSP